MQLVYYLLYCLLVSIWLEKNWRFRQVKLKFCNIPAVNIFKFKTDEDKPGSKLMLNYQNIYHYTQIITHFKIDTVFESRGSRVDTLCDCKNYSSSSYSKGFSFVFCKRTFRKSAVIRINNNMRNNKCFYEITLVIQHCYY